MTNVQNSSSAEEFCALVWDEKVDEVKAYIEKNKDYNINSLNTSRGKRERNFLIVLI
jgi:hypothetical protein